MNKNPRKINKNKMSVIVPREITDHDEILEYIAQQVKKTWNNAGRYFLLQCCYWSKSYYRPDTWRAEVGNVDDFIYGFGSDEVDFADETDITISSWKGNHEDAHIGYAPSGNLPYSGPRFNYKGTIWTRGE